VQPTSRKILGSFALAMIAVTAIIDLRGLPMMASYGFGVIAVYGLAALLFLIPSSLVCAELATTIPEQGGMYIWVRQAFGDKMGFFSIWLEWLNNVIGFPASLTFIAVTLTYLMDPALALHKGVILTLTLSILWLVTGFTLLGIKASSRLNMLGALFGTIIPAIIIVILGLAWVLIGKPLQFQPGWSHLLPSWNESNPGFFAAIILGFGGMQIVAFHTVNVSNPKHSFPRAIFSAVSIIITICLFTALAIASVVPAQELNLISGLIDGFNRFFLAFHMAWATPVLISLIILSLFATLNAWFLGPARGLAVAAQNGFLPKALGRSNKKDVPAAIIILQAVICSILSVVFLLMPDISSAFWVLLNLSSQSALIVYILIFAAALKLRSSSKRIGITCAAAIGILTCVIALLTSLIPPSLIHTGGLFHYEMILILSNLVFLSIPFLIIYRSSRL